MSNHNITPFVTVLTDILAMVENNNITLGRNSTSTTSGQWASVIRDARSLVDSYKATKG